MRAHTTPCNNYPSIAYLSWVWIWWQQWNNLTTAIQSWRSLNTTLLFVKYVSPFFSEQKNGKQKSADTHSATHCQLNKWKRRGQTIKSSIFQRTTAEQNQNGKDATGNWWKFTWNVRKFWKQAILIQRRPCCYLCYFWWCCCWCRLAVQIRRKRIGHDEKPSLLICALFLSSLSALEKLRWGQKRSVIS